MNAEPAFTLWQDRRDFLTDTIADMAGEGTTPAAFDTIVEETVSLPVAELLAIDAARENGEGVQTRLDQLTLSNAAFVYLLGIRRLVAAGQPVTALEWENVHSILVQVLKQRRSAEWREEEQAAGVTLSPDFFLMPDAFAPPSATATAGVNRWRVGQDARFEWLDTLQSRVDQERGVLASLHDVISGVEEDTLPSLRNALIVAGGVGTDLAAKGSWATDRLLIDAKAGGCQKTTRLAQAIETMQAVLFAARSGQSAVLQTLVLTLDAPDFDEEWRWIGSYATWRGRCSSSCIPRTSPSVICAAGRRPPSARS